MIKYVLGLALILLCSASLQAQIYPLNQMSPVADGFTSGGAANCQRGYRFQVNSGGVVVTQLGCWYPDGTTEAKTVTLFDFTTQAILAQVTCGPGAGWQFTTLSTPVALTNGAQYIVEGFTITSSYYFHSAPPAAWNPTGVIQYLDMRYANNCTANTFPTSILSPHQYGVVDIGYTFGQGTQLTAVSSGGVFSPPAADMVVMDMTANTFQNNYNLNSVTFTQIGTAPDSDITSVDLWRDNNSNGAVDAGDASLGTGTLTSGSITFSGSPLQALTAGTPTRLLLSVDTITGFTLNNTIQFQVSSSSDISWSGGTDLTSFPVTGGSWVYTNTVTRQFGTLGTGNAFPFNYSNASGRFQSAYSSAEINMPAGSLITEVRVFGSTITTVPQYGNLRVRLGHTTLGVSALTANFDSNYTGALTTCLGPVNFTPTVLGSWYVFPLTTPFVYNGTDGVLIDWSYDSRSGSGWSISSATGRSRVYLNGGSYVSPSGTASSTSGNYGIEFDLNLPQDGTLLGATGQGGVFTAPVNNVVVLDMNAHTFVNNNNINSITFTKAGTVADGNISNISLYVDVNGNGTVDAGDTTLASGGVLSGGIVTFSGSPLVALSTSASTRLLLAVNTSAAVTPGQTMSFAIASSSDITWSGGTDMTTFPINGGNFVSQGPASTYPYTLGFETQPPYFNSTFVTAAGAFPTVVTVGAAPGSGGAAASGGYGVTGGPILGSTPNSGSGMLDMFGNTGTGAVALDLLFDLSAYTTSDYIELEFYWNDEGLDVVTATDAMCGVFISTNGGTTWELAAYQIPTNTTEGVWNRVRLDLSSLLAGVSLTYTNQTVVRFQMAQDSNADHLLLDDIALDFIPPQLRIDPNTAVPATVAANAATGDQWVATFDVRSIGSAQQPSSATATQIGTVANTALTNLKLWADANANGTWEASDTQLGTTVASMTGNQVTFTGSPLASLSVNQAATLFVTAVVGNSAAPSSTVQFQVTASGDVVSSPGPTSGIFPVQGGSTTVVPPPLSGVVTVANGNPGSAFDYGDLGDVFDALEAVGVSGPVIIELYDDGGAFTPTEKYRLGVVGTTTTVVTVPGVSATNTITIRAASGETPVLSGSGAADTYTAAQTGVMAFRNIGNITLEGLTITGATNFGVMWYVSTTGAADNLVIRNCRFHNISSGSGTFLYGSSTGTGPNNVIIENNMFWNVFGQGAWSGGGGMGVIGFRRTGNNVVIRHNSILVNSSAASASALQGSGATTPVAEFSYNVVYVDSAATGVLFLSDGSATPPATADRNVIHLVGSATMSNVTGLTTWADWQTSGRDANGLNANPEFVNIATGTEDLHVLATSPALELAVGSPVTTDIDGETRPIGTAPDSGADERAAAPQPIIGVARGSAISNGGTDNVGNVPTQGGSFTWTVSNTGTVNLNITTPIGTTPGTGTPGVNVTAQPGNVVTPSGSTTFTIQITPAQGAFDFQVSITNNDVSENPFVFTVTGNGVGPEIDISRTASVPSGGVDNVGNVSTAGQTFTWTISNSDIGDLQITTPIGATPGTGTPGVNVTTQPANTVTQGNTTTFDILITPVVGAFTVDISIANNDQDENPYTFTIQGNGFNPNGPAQADPATGSSFSGPTNGPLTQVVMPGATLANADIELTDPEGDQITVTGITLITAAPPAGTITAPAVPAAGQPLTLSWTGTAPTGVATYTWEVDFQDAVNGTPVTTEVTITIGDLPPTHQIASASGGDGSGANPYTAEYTETMGSASDIDLASVSDPNVGQAVSLGTITPGAGNPAGGAGFTFALTGGFLNVAPGGALSANDVGTHTFDVDVTDGTNTVTIAVSIDVAAVPVITTGSPLPTGEQGISYTPLQIATTGGAGTLNFAVTAGTLPPGMSLSTGGMVSGTPTAQGAYNFTVTVTDANNIADTQVYDITINPPATGNPTITTTTLPNGTVGQSYGPATVVATGGTGVYSFAVSGGTFPPGLTLNPGTGAITGTPSTAAIYNFDITVTDSAFATATQSYQVTIKGTGGGNGSGSGNGGGGGCAANTDTGMWGLLLGALALLAVVLRVRAVRD